MSDWEEKRLKDHKRKEIHKELSNKENNTIKLLLITERKLEKKLDLLKKEELKDKTKNRTD